MSACRIAQKRCEDALFRCNLRAALDFHFSLAVSYAALNHLQQQQPLLANDAGPEVGTGALPQLRLPKGFFICSGSMA
jgi:hypothetical protein